MIKNLAMMARPTKAIWEMWNKALSWPPLSSLLFFSIFLSLPPVLMYSLRLLTSVCECECVCVCVCVCGELWGKGTEERASESSCPSLSTSAFSNAPRSMSLCVSREEREGKVHAAERKCGFQCIDAFQFSILCRWQGVSVCMHECVCVCVCVRAVARVHSAMFEQLS